MPTTATVVNETTRLCLAFVVVISDTIAQGRGRQVYFTAVLGVGLDGFRLHIDNVGTLFLKGFQHPDNVVTVVVDGVGEIEAATAPLGTGHDKQVGEASAMQAQPCLGAIFLAHLSQGLAVLAINHVEGGGCHPLKACGVDQYVEGVFHTVLDDAVFVDAVDAPRRGIHQMHVRQIKRRQILVVKSRPLAGIGIIGLQCSGRVRICYHGINAGADLLHGLKVFVQLLLHPFFRRELFALLGFFSIVLDTPRQVVIVGLYRIAHAGDSAKAFAPGRGPAWLVFPGFDFF